MSDSELSESAIPSNAIIEETLRRIVREALGKGDEITVNLARSRAETDLGLDAGFLKDNSDWKKRSKDVISSAVEEEHTESPAKKKDPPRAKSKPEPKKKEKAAPKAKAGIKRASSDARENPRKRRKKEIVDSGDEEAELEEEAENDMEVSEEEPKPKPKSQARKASAKNVVDSEEEEVPKPKAKRRRAPAKNTIDSEDEEEENTPEPLREPETEDQAVEERAALEPSKEPELPQATTNAATAEADDDSDLSSLIDEPPARKKRQKKSGSPKPKATKSKPASKPSTSKTLSPDEEQIKTLQSNLLKCGVRKLWHKELAPYDTAKAKIKHLQGMLKDVGMSGRFSAEKAKQIKEARELQAELESAKEFAEKFGHEEEESKKSGARKRAPPQLVDFGDSGDEGSD